MTHQLSTDDVTHLATLSALTLDSDETEALRADIANILTYIDQLAQLDTTGVEPTYQVTGLRNVFRDDVVAGSAIDADTFVEAAAESVNHQFKVPKVL